MPVTVRTVFPDELGGLGCVLLLPMREGSGTSVSDLSGYNNHGTLVGPPTWVDGRYGKCLSFNGTSDYVDVKHSASLAFTKEDFSIELWVYLNILTTTNPFAKGTDVTEGYWLNIRDSGRFDLVTSQAGAQQTTSSALGAVGAASWYHLVATRVGSVGKVYSQGLNITNSSESHIDPAFSTLSGKIGRHGSAAASYLDGLIDSVRIYNRALSADEVLAHFLGTRYLKVR